MRRPLLHVISGQAMVISVLVMGFMALSFVLIGVRTLTNEQQSSTAFEQKATASALATGCMEQAMDRLGRSASYGGNETITTPNGTCVIRPIVAGSGIWTLETWAQAGNQYTRYQVGISSRLPITINSWTEVVGF